MTADHNNLYAEFARADAVWRAEIVLAYGANLARAYAEGPEGHGNPGTLLRSAWEVREQARMSWLTSRDRGGL